MIYYNIRNSVPLVVVPAKSSKENAVRL